MIIRITREIAIIYILFILIFQGYKNFYRSKEYLLGAFSILFWIYFLYLLKYAIFPIEFVKKIAESFQKGKNIYQIASENLNLIPIFHGFNRKDFLLNVIMTYPMGVLLPLVKKINLKRCFLLGLGVGLGIELIQLILIFLQGYTFRNVNINDTIANFIGIVLGFISIKIFAKLFNEIFVNSNIRGIQSFREYLFNNLLS